MAIIPVAEENSRVEGGCSPKYSVQHFCKAGRVQQIILVCAKHGKWSSHIRESPLVPSQLIFSAIWTLLENVHGWMLHAHKLLLQVVIYRSKNCLNGIFVFFPLKTGIAIPTIPMPASPASSVLPVINVWFHAAVNCPYVTRKQTRSRKKG